MRAVIFANGRLDISRGLSQTVALRSDDLVIAADGGAHHCLLQGVFPHFVIGDLDSLDEQELAQLEAHGTKIVPHPKRKDYTDLELALRHAQELGADEILILGALGARWDQTIANILLPSILSPIVDLTSGNTIPRISISDGDQGIFFMRGGDRLEILGRPGDVVSLIPITERARGVTTQNLEYPLDARDLLLGSTLGISNVLLSEPGWVTLLEGLMLCVVIHQNSE